MSDNKQTSHQQKDPATEHKNNSPKKHILPWEVRFLWEGIKRDFCDLVGIKYKEHDEKKFHM